MKKISVMLLMLLTFAMYANIELPLKSQIRLCDVRETSGESYIESESQVITRLKSTDLNDDDAMIYVFKKFGYGDMSYGLLKFQAQNPNNLVNIKPFSSGDGYESISAATYVNGEYWVYVYQSWWGGMMTVPVGIGVLNPETGEYDIKYATGSIHTYNEHFIEMTYDPSTNKVYGVQYVTDLESETRMMDLWVIDPSEGTYEPKRLGKVDAYMFGMAARDGVIYGVTQDYTDDDISKPEKVRLIKFDPSKVEDGICKTEHIADIDEGKRVIRYDQTMEFDHATGRLWWAAQETANNGGYVCEIDITDGSLRHENRIPDASQYVAMAIPYQIAEPLSPSYVTEFRAQPNELNSSYIDLKWKNPIYSYNRELLTQISGVKIYRNGDLVDDLKKVSVGEDMIWTDNSELTAGIYVYRLVPYNESGEGLWREKEAFSGIDVPGVVQNVKYVVDNDNVTITWQAPVEGRNKGWFDKESLTYDIYRGSYRVASALTVTEYSDHVNYYDHFTYKIVPVTNQGEGSPYEMNISYGPAYELPYENNLSTEELAEELTIADNNSDGHTWNYSEEEQSYIYISHYENVADDYLFLPAINLEEGKSYRLSFKYITSNYTNVVEDFEVMVSTAANVESVSRSLEKYENLSGVDGAVWYSRSVDYVCEAEGVANFVFHIYSKQGMGRVGISDIMIRELGDQEVKAQTLQGDVDCYVNTPTEFVVNISNEGVSDVSDVVVKVVTEDGTELVRKTYGRVLSPGDNADVELEWAPTSEGTTLLYAEVEKEGDTYYSDNRTSRGLRVSVHSENGDRFITIGQSDQNRAADLVYLENKQSRSQMLYYADEIGLDENVLITGVQYAYTPSIDVDYLAAIPVEIHLGNTDQTRILASVYEGSFIDISTMTEVYDLDMELNGDNDVYNEVYIKFSEPFEYDCTKNLVVDIYKNLEEVFGNVGWYVDYSSGIPYRGAVWTAGYNYELNPIHSSVNYVPFTKFSYRSINSVEQIKENKISITVNDSEIRLSETSQLIKLYDMSGCLIAVNKNSDVLPIANINKGIYLLNIINDSNSETHKVLVK